VKLAIATPFYKSAEVPYVTSLIKSVKLLDDLKITWDFFTVNGTYIDNARNLLVDKFYQTDFTDLLFIDSDLSWNIEGLLHLLRSPFDLTGGAYLRKNDWESYTTKIKQDENGIIIQDPETGLIEVNFLSTGFLKISKYCINKMIDAFKDNWYFDKGNKIINLFECPIKNNTRYSEDITFSEKWISLGGKCYLEPRINFGHTDIKTYSGNFHKHLSKQIEIERIQQAIKGAKL